MRSSIALRLGVDIGALAPVDRHVEGVVEMMLDATANCNVPVSREWLFGWHATFFPTGYSVLSKIRVGGWRDDASGAMQWSPVPSAGNTCISKRRQPTASRPKRVVLSHGTIWSLIWRLIRQRCGSGNTRESGSEVETPPQLNMPLRSLSIRNS